MGETKKKRKQYETPRKQWDSNLLERERKLSNAFGLRNKKELRRLETWLKYKRQIAKSLLALTPERRAQRQQELISGLVKIGLVRGDATLDDVLGLRIDELLEKRLQTMVMRKGLAATAKQARQFVVHGHISINGRKIDAPGYIVPAAEVSGIGWFRKPIKVEAPQQKNDLKKEFEESAGTAGEGAAAEGAEAQAQDSGESSTGKEVNSNG